MSFLDKTGLTTLWSKIKTLSSKYLPLSGGTITGDLQVTGVLVTQDIIILYNGNTYMLNVEKCKELGILSLA